MSVALDQSLGTGNNSGATTATLSTAAAVASGGFIVVVAGRFCSTPTATMSLSGGGLTWTQDKTVTSGNLRCSVFSAPAPAGLASSTTLTLTHSSSSDCIFAAVSYTGVATSSPAEATNSSSGSTAAWTTASVAGSSGDLLVGGVFTDSSIASSTPGGSANERFDTHIAGQSETLVFEDILSISGSTALTGTWNTTGSWASAAVAYLPAAGGGGTTTKKLAALGVG